MLMNAGRRARLNYLANGFRVLVGGAQVKEWLGQQALEMDR